MKTLWKTSFWIWLLTLYPSLASAASPDLLFAPGSYSIDKTSVTVGTSITLTVTVKNQGDAASVATKVHYYMDRASVAGAPWAKQIGQLDVPALGAGASSSPLVFTYQVPLTTAAATDYLLCFWVDPIAANAESNENNNALCFQNITVITNGPPPLQPELLAARASLAPLAAVIGETVTFTLDVKNNGLTNSAQTKVYFYAKIGVFDFSLASKIGEVTVPALLPGITASNLTLAYVIPAGTTPAINWHYLYFIDGPLTVAESDENNNAGGWNNVSISSPNTPDLLTLTNTISGNNNTFNSGDDVTVTLDIFNDGNGASTAGKIAFFLHQGGSDFTSAFKVGEIDVPVIPGRGVSAARAFTYTIPSATPAGSYSFCYWIDSGNSTPEADENNNKGCWTIQVVSRPDLVTTGNPTIFPPRGFPGETFNFSLGVLNDGVAASAASKVYFYLHKDTQDFTTASKIGEIDLPALAAGASATGLTFSYTVPSNTPVGSYNFCYTLDGAGGVTETLESNNSICWNPISIEHRPDLWSGTNSIAPVVNVPGGLFTIRMDVHNRGSAAAPASTAYIYAHKDTADYTTASKIGEVAVPALAAGQAATIAPFEYRISDTAELGDYQFCYSLDATSAVDEGNEFNNQACWTISLTPASDLTGSTNSISPASGLPGDRFTAKLVVRNRGNLASGASKIYYYFHAGSPDWSAASKVREVTVPSIAARSFSAELEAVYDVPANTPAGEYYLSYWIDPTDTEAESDDQNNTGSWKITITNQGDLVARNALISPPSGVPGTAFTMSLQVLNDGTAASSAGKVAFYRFLGSANFDPTNKVGELDLPALQPGALSSTLTFVHTTPTSLPGGIYQFWYWIDATGTTAEIDEVNNRSSWADIEILSLPDLLAPNTVISPLVGIPGKRFTLTVDVLNQGVMASSSNLIHFFLNRNAADYGAASKIGEVAVPSLSANASQLGLKFDYTVPTNTVEGNYVFSYWIDPANILAEGNEDNNRGAWPVVPIELAADLIMSTNSISPISGLPGDRFTMTVQIRNRGVANSAPSKVGFFVKKDAADYSAASKVGEIGIPSLAPDEISAPLSFSYVLPANAAFGNYQFCYWIDPDDALDEALEDNNKGCWPAVPIVNRADVAASRTLISPLAGVPGTEFTLEVAVTNRGTIASPATKLGFYLHKDTPEISVPAKIGDMDVPALEAKTETVLTFKYVVPLSLPSGTYVFCYWVDPPGKVFESDESNNQGCWDDIPLLQKADLTALDSSITPVQGLAGDPFTMRVTVKNSGVLASPEAKVRFYRNLNEEAFSGDAFVGEVTVPALAAGATSAELVFTNTTPDNLPQGNYFFSYWIDATEVVDEGSDANNRGVWPDILIVRDAELVTANLGITPSSGVPGDDFTMLVDVMNRGKAASAATTIHFFRARGQADYSAGAKIGELNLPALNPGASATGLTFHATVPPGSADGNYVFAYWIDAPGLVREANEDDNRGSWTVAISNGPDLVSFVNGISASTGVPGDSFRMTVDVKNKGNAPAPATKVQFFVNQDSASFSPSDKVGEVAVPALAQGATAAGLQLAYTFPPNGTPGLYFFSYEIVPPTSVLEASEENNHGSWTVRITDAPDLVGGASSITPVSGQPGDTFTMSLDVVNTGTRASATNQVTFYLNDAPVGAVAVPGLAAKATAAGLTFAYQIPSDAPEGTYRFCYHIDEANEVIEGNDLNNEACYANIPIINAPDLIAGDAHITPIQGVPGDTFRMTIDVQNRGTRASGASSIDFHMHLGGSDYSAASKIGSISLAALPVGAMASALPFEFRVPLGTPAGEYSFCYSIDATNSVTESSENNNRGCWADVALVDAADLIGLDDSITPTEVLPGQSITMKVSVRNTGNVPSVPAKLQFFMTLTNQTQKFAASSLIGEVNVPVLASQATAANLTLTYPLPSTTPAGKYDFCYWIDATGLVLEGSELNNQGCWTEINVPDSSELAPVAASINPASGQPGTLFTISLNVTNRGSRASSPAEIHYFLTRGAASSDPLNKIGEIPLPSIARLSSVSNLTFSYRTPEDLLDGTYFFSYKIDGANTEAESNENNNEGSFEGIPIINAADLIPVAGSITPGIAGPGAKFTLSIDVKNVGTRPSTATKAFFYFHKDSSDLTLASKVGEINIPALGTNQLAAGLVFQHTVSSNLALGTYYFCYALDGPKSVRESDEVNNEVCFESVVIVQDALQTRFSPLLIDATGTVELLLTGPVGEEFQIQQSSDFKTWTNLGLTVTNVTGAIRTTDSQGKTRPRRFYRATVK